MSSRRAAVRALVAVVVAAACRGDPDRLPFSETRGDDGVSEVRVDESDLDGLPEWSLASSPSVAIGGREGVPGHDLFGVRSAFATSSGEIVIASGGASRVRVYSASGEHRLDVGGHGEGPGEFSALHTAAIMRGDTIVVYDAALRRISRLGPSGEFVSDTRVDFPAGRSYLDVRGVLDAGRWVLVPGFDRVFRPGPSRDTASYLLYAGDGSVLDTLARLPGRETLTIVSAERASRTDVAFGRASLGAAGAQTIVLGANDSYEFEIRDAEGVPRARVLGLVPSCEVADGEIEAWVEARFGRESESSWMRGAIVDDMARYETHPAYAALEVDRLGLVWVGRRPCGPGGRGASSDLTRWDVYSPAGRPAARLEVDADLRVLDIGEDYVIALSRDDLDREIVARFELFRR